MLNMALDKVIGTKILISFYSFYCNVKKKKKKRKRRTSERNFILSLNKRILNTYNSILRIRKKLYSRSF